MRIKVGDTFPNPSADLNADITGATAVVFRMRHLDGSPFLEQPAVIDDAATGIVHYVWQAGNTGQEGAYRCDWRVTYAGGAIQRFPAASYLEIVIAP
jgi:hypothetical protein